MSIINFHRHTGGFSFFWGGEGETESLAADYSRPLG